MRAVLSLALALTASIACGADIAGRYADKGTVVAANDGTASREMSLHALLQLDLDYTQVHDRYQETDYVEFRQGRETLEARMCAADDTLRSHGAWSRGEGYRPGETEVMLQLRGPRLAGDSFMLVMSLVGDGKLLQVDVTRISATTAGPVTRRVGTYLFPRVD